ncbi:hmgA [Symbiodinium natans]|uniref:HmgA protein n=1 Tax=Symbiodinium natans TaxID=878477 RepID=A0A812K5H0_9DINO|nr:hmgA [Symbiodinium natans]
MDDLCYEWCEGQGLDEACLIKLLELDVDTRQTVINGFEPKPGTKNVSGLFMGYVRSIQQAAAGAPAALAAPAQMQWKGIPRGISKGIPKGTKGRGKEAKSLAMPTMPAMPAMPSIAQNAAAQLQEEAIKFAESWGLDDDCIAQLLAQPPQARGPALPAWPATRELPSGMILS